MKPQLRYHHRSLKGTGYSNNDIYKIIKNEVESDGNILYKVIKISNILPLINVFETLSETLALLRNHNFYYSDKIDISSFDRKLLIRKAYHESVVVQIRSEFCAAIIFVNYFSDYYKKITGCELPEFRYKIRNEKLFHNLEDLNKVILEAETAYRIKEIDALPFAERETKLLLLIDEFNNYQFIKNTRQYDKYIKLFEDKLKTLQRLKHTTPLPIDVNQNRTKQVIAETFKNMDKKGWQYAFMTEQDYNLFVDLLINFFAYKNYSIPETALQLKRTCKTKVAKALGGIHSELSENPLKSDTEYFKIVKVLNHFKEVSNFDLVKAMQR